jgi:hypothetical protein
MEANDGKIAASEVRLLIWNTHAHIDSTPYLQIQVYISIYLYLTCARTYTFIHCKVVCHDYLVTWKSNIVLAQV